MLNEAYAKGATAALLTATIGQHLDQIASDNPTHPALIMPHQNIRWTYAELVQHVDRLATGLLALGIVPGDRVGIWSPNRYEWVLTQFATAKIGAIMVCINPAYRLYELAYALNKVQCKAIISAERFKTSHYLTMLEELAPELASCEPGRLQAEKLPHLRWVIRMGDAVSPGMLNFADVCDLGTPADAAELASIGNQLDPTSPINIQFTSGTTGLAKGATLSHRNILNNAYFAGQSMRLTKDDKLCIPVPLYHCFGMVLGTLVCVAHGATMVLPCEAFDPELVVKAVQEEQCTALHGVPTMFIAELDLPNLGTFDLSSLRTGIIAGSTCPIELMKRLIELMDLTELVIGYGQTECSPIDSMTAIDDSLEARVTTVGRPHTNWEMKIGREDGSIAAIGETGEVCARGYGVMLGYWEDDTKTGEAIDQEGWMHSGDLGEMDGDGFIKITGRIKDMIIRGGENIYPREIEEFLYTHPAIQEVQVFGIPDNKYGETVAAWVQLREGETTTPETIRDYCQGQITHFKIPRHIKLVTAFPMTVTGKIQKFVMRDQYAEELGLNK
ncbi:MAG TPA: AMP-binding protein [Gammaproteobacteria bacterium]|nr:AMP-binding protein [Gammaproteobacteria bacterium]|tara:strand:- start:985 stop:2658 length:1674 start_codon:yes stop_codon:yes gene_type:complete